MYQVNPIPVITSSVNRNNKSGMDGYLFNMGGPMSRSRTEHIQSTLLGKNGSHINCPQVFKLGLDFGKNSPIETIEQLLLAEGFNDPEDLRARFLVFSSVYICHTALSPNRRPVITTPGDLVLQQALLLGLCTATYFDPSRPILWTNTSLTRCLDLFDMRGFYA